MNKKLKQTLSVLLCFCMIFGSVAVSAESIGTFLGSLSFNVFAEDTADTVTYSYDSTSNTLTVSGSGAMPNYESYTEQPWNSYATTAVKVVVTGVTSIGNNAFRGFSKVTSYDIADTVTAYGSYAFYGNTALTGFTMENTVLSVGNCAFQSCGLTSVTFSTALKTIGSSAFCGCKLVNVSIPDSVTDIGNAAFRLNEWTLKSIKFPKSMKTIKSGMCQECYNLNSVTFPENLETIENNAFLFARFYSGTLTFPETLKYIGDHAFRYSYGLSQLTIPKNVTYIGYQAFRLCGRDVTSLSVNILSTGDLQCSYSFQDCAKLTSATFAEGLTSISGGLFSGCTGLTSVTLPSTLKIIENSTFSGCTSLATVKIPDGVTSVGNSAFDGCTAITSLTIPYSVKSLGENSFKSVSSVNFTGCEDYWNTVTGYSDCGASTKTFTGGCKIGDSAYLNLLDSESASVYGSGDIYSYEDYTQSPWYGYNGSLKSVVFEENCPENIRTDMFKDFIKLSSVTFSNCIKSIGDYAFSGCSALSSIIFTDNITTIGNSAFKNCSALSSVTMGAGIKTVGDNAFENCSAFSSVTFGDNVEAIGKYAFSNCTALNSVIFGNGVKTIDDYAFYKCSALTEITVPGNVERLGKYCFYNCSKLTAVTLSKGVKTIDNYCFARNDKLSSVTLCSGLETIGARAFLDCYALESIEIPYTVTNIGKCAFTSSGLKACYIYNPNVVISADSFVNTDDISVYCPENSTAEAVLENVDLTVPEGRGSPTYTLNSDGESYSVSGVSSGNCSYVVIPSTYNGKPVNGIKDNTFKDETSINNIYLPSGTLNSVGKNVIKNTGYYNLHADGDLTIGDICFGLKGSVSDVTIPEGVRIIPDFAFAGKACIISLSLPDSVETIGNYAFYGCGNMDLAGNTLYLKRFKESIDYLDSYKNHPGWDGYYDENAIAYRDSYNCIYQSTMGTGIKTIGEKAFYGCSALTAFKIVSEDVVIGSKAFEKCGSLYVNIDYKNPVVKTLYENQVKALISDESFEYIFKEDFSGLVLTYQREEVIDFIVPAYICEIPVTEIGYNISRDNNAYVYNDSQLGSYTEKQRCIKTVVIPDTVEIIRACAFQVLYNCTSLTLGNSLKRIENTNFARVSVTEITVPASLEYAYNLCAASSTLTTINLPGEGNHLNLSYSFGYCTAVTTINNYEYIYCVCSDFCKGSPWMTEYLSNAPDNSIVYLGNCAVSWKGTLPENIVIKDGTLSLARQLFYRYSASFKTVTLPEGLEIIEDAAFFGQSARTNFVSVNLPSSLKYIGINAFANCKNLVFESFPTNKNLELGAGAFGDLTFKTCVVPEWIDVGGAYLSSDTIVLPSTLKCIPSNTIYLAKTIYISEGTEQICEDAFFGLNLEEIYIPSSVTFIDDEAFSGTNSGVIYCEKGSCAENFAKVNGYKYKSFDTVEAKDGVEIDYVKNEITATVYGATNILDLLSVDLSTVTYKPSLKTENTEIFGTGSIIAIKTDNNNYVFTLVVKGDVNGDGVCDVLDALQTENAINGNTELKSYQMSAITENDTLTVSDYQNVINQVVNQ